MENTHDDEDDVEIVVPFVVEGFNVPQRTHYTSRLVLPQGIEEVNDQGFRMFADEMREQYEILESEFNASRRDSQMLKSELIRMKHKCDVVEESYKMLMKKLMKVITRDYPQFRFGDTIVDERLNVKLPVYNENTKRFTNYSNSTRSFLEIIKSQTNIQEH